MLYHAFSNLKPPDRRKGLAIMGDITERKQAETKLKLVRALLDNSNDAIEVLDPVTLRFLDINATGCLALGYTREELLSMTIYDIDMAYSVAPQKVLAQLRESEHALFETIHRRKDGSTFPVEVNVVSVELDKPYLLAITRDITERKLLEAAQQDSARRLQRIIDFSVLLSSANEAIAQMENEADLLRSLCELAVHHAHLRLAWIGQPDSDGWFQMLAAGGLSGGDTYIRVRRTSRGTRTSRPVLARSKIGLQCVIHQKPSHEALGAACRSLRD